MVKDMKHILESAGAKEDDTRTLKEIMFEVVKLSATKKKYDELVEIHGSHPFMDVPFLSYIQKADQNGWMVI